MSQKTLTEDARAGAPSTASAAASAKRWWILAVIALAQLMVVLDATIVNIALPSAQADLGFSDGNRQWIVTAYALAFGSLLLLGGRIADLFGRKTAFLIGVVGFAGRLRARRRRHRTSRCWSPPAPCRALFGALLAPAALSLLNTTFTDARERARAFGVYGAIAGAGGAVGLLLGGVLTDALDWRWTLYVNLVFAVVAFVGGWLLLRNHRDAAELQARRARHGAGLRRPVLPRLRLLQRRDARLGFAADLGLPDRRRRAAGRLHLVADPGRAPAAAAARPARPQPRRPPSSPCSSPAPACSASSSSSPTTSS